MNRNILMAAALAVGTTGFAAPAMADQKAPELTPAQLSEAQSESYAVPVNTAFSASIAALQSLGYVDITASKDAGTISGQTEAKGKIFYNILWGFGKKKLTQKASLLIEEYGAGQSLVRLNLHVTESKQRGLFGTAFSDGKLVTVAEPYDTFFTALKGEVDRRAPAAPAPAAASVAAPVTTAAPSTTEAPASAAGSPQL